MQNSAVQNIAVQGSAVPAGPTGPRVGETVMLDTVMKTEITRADIIPLKTYAAERKTRRKALTEMKKHRRVEVGPYVTFYFENYDTMWHQIHEMLYIEKGGEDQIDDELRAYNPLIPQGDELIATVMFEIDDRLRRQTLLGRLGGVEDRMTITVNGEPVQAMPEADVDRTTADGKASSVQFVHFKFSPGQIAAFRTPGTRVEVAINHENYGHIAVMRDDIRAALAGDFA